MSKKLGTILWITILAATLFQVGLAQAGEVKAGGQTEWEKIVAAAKKDGEVRLWGDMEITHPDIAAAFAKEYPYIKVVSVTGKVGDLMPRIIAERRAGKYLADLYEEGKRYQVTGFQDPEPVMRLLSELKGKIKAK